MKDIYKEVTDLIIEGLEKDIIVWDKTWISGDHVPISIHGKKYRGTNLFLLSLVASLKNYKDNRWLTFNQAKKLNGNVKKGERGSLVILWKPLINHHNECHESDYKKFCNYKNNKGYLAINCERRFLITSYTVFNVEQCEKLEIPELKISDGPDNNYDPIIEAEAIIENYINREKLEVDLNGSEAFYIPSKDKLTMPKHNSFVNNESFYSTYFHELAHSTGNEKRLNRKDNKQIVRFGDPDYAREELIAEMTSGFLSNFSGIDTKHVQRNRLAYIQNWISVLKNDKKLFISAAQSGQKATEYILDIGGENK